MRGAAVRSAAAACPQALLRADAPNLARILLGEPEATVRPGGDASRSAPHRGDGKLGDDPSGGAASDLVPKVFGEPQVAIRPGGDTQRQATRRGDGKLGDDPSGG